METSIHTKHRHRENQPIVTSKVRAQMERRVAVERAEKAEAELARLKTTDEAIFNDLRSEIRGLGAQLIGANHGLNTREDALAALTSHWWVRLGTVLRIL